tara:strand:- start:790 stop:2697 length:1908 start_codon:yes stop_codon:yes gene_type:complete
MALIKLEFRPGINRDQTDYSGEGGWWSGDKVRFRSGFPEKLGGWVKRTVETFIGTCRQMWAWITTFNDNFLSLGTNSKLYIYVGGYFYDITPTREEFTTTDTDNSVQTTITSTTVKFNLVAPHGATTGDYVVISGVTGNVGGVPDSEINSTHEVTVVDSDTFSIVVTTAATSSVSAGGGTAIVLAFQITPGGSTVTLGYGWGTGTWGRNAWGLGSDDPIDIQPRDWWLDNFDNDLVANIRNGPAYYWERGTDSSSQTALGTPAILLSEFAAAEGYTAASVPVQVMQMMVSQQDKHLLAFGAVPYGSTDTDDFDPLLIRWSDQDNPGQWTPTTTNSSGFLRISRGSAIIRAMPTRQETLVWTDSNLYTLQFLGTSDVFGLQEYASDISIMSSRACASAENSVFWMGHDKFYVYTGRVETLPCTLRRYVFQDINRDQAAISVVCGTNEEWNEVWWFYPSADSECNNRYVIYNYLDKVWYYGNMDRTGWLDTHLHSNPLAVETEEGETTGYLYIHEDGVDADGAAMEAYIQSNDFDLGDGDQFMLARRVIPDVEFDGSTATAPEVTLALRPRNFPGSDFVEDDDDAQPVIETSVGVYTNQVFIRARARQMALKISSEDLGVQWQLGAPRIDVRPDGKR